MKIQYPVFLEDGKICPYCEYCKHDLGLGCKEYPSQTTLRRFPLFPPCLNYPPGDKIHFEIDPEKCKPGWEGLEVLYPDWSNAPED